MDIDNCALKYSHTIFSIEAVEDVDKKLVNNVHDFIVVLIDGHLKVKPGELAQVAVGVRVLCPAACQSVRMQLMPLNHSTSIL